MFQFGNNNNNNQFKFGGNNAQSGNSGTGFSFGASGANTTSQSVTGGGGGFQFGNNNNKQGGGFQFGNNNNNNNNNSGGGFQFGNNNNKQGGGFQFGNNNNNNNNNNSGGGFQFGNNNNNKQGGGFQFGNNNNTQGGGFSFGNNNNNNNNSGGGFQFGNNNKQGGGGFSFGNNNSGGGFQFGNNNNNSGGFSFGNNNNNNNNMFGQQQQQQQQVSTLEAQIMAIMKAYHTQSPECRFQYMLYNRVAPPEQASDYGKRPPNANPRLWKQAVRNNPDPNNLVVCQINGFQDLKKRIQRQEQAHKTQQQQLQKLKQIVLETKQAHEQMTKVTIADLRRRHLDLSHRLLVILGAVQVRQTASIPLMEQEVAYRKKLATIRRELAKPTQFQARVRELASIVRVREERAPATGHFVDAANLAKIRVFLDMNRKALLHLQTVLEKDRRDVDIVVKGLDAWPTGGPRGAPQSGFETVGNGALAGMYGGQNLR